MPRPEHCGRDNGVPVCQREQIFIASNQIIGFLWQQSTEYRLIGGVAKSRILHTIRFDDIGEKHETVG